VTDQDVTGVELLREWRANGEFQEKIDSKFDLMGIRFESENPETLLLLVKTGAKKKTTNPQ
jgi:hypothetical protein